MCCGERSHDPIPSPTVHHDLQSLIRLQELDLAAERMRRRIADIPSVQAALDERIATLTAAVAAVKDKTSASQADSIEKRSRATANQSGRFHA